MTAVKPILVIKLGALGDFVLALAAMKRIRLAHSEARITLLTTPPFEALARASGYFDAIETDGRPEGWKATLAMLWRLRRAGYGRIYDLQTSSRSSRYFYGLLPFAPQWSGIAAGCALPHRNRDRDHMHTLERQADQLKDAGIWPDAPVTPGAAPPPDLSWCAKVPVPLPKGEDRPLALLVPGASPHRPEKRWPLARFAALAAQLQADGMAVAVIGGGQEKADAAAILRSAPGALDLTGRTDFLQIAALGARAALAVGNDTGPLHMIAAAGAPTVALFSAASDPALCAPRGHVTILRTPDLADLLLEPVMGAARAYEAVPHRQN
jgi:ADP-heptose:LPS heptosyltransferase